MPSVLKAIPELKSLIDKGQQEATSFFPGRQVPLHAMMTTCGYSEERRATYDWHGIRRGKAEFALFQYTISGEGMLSYEGKHRPILPGQAMLLHFPHDNRYWLADGKQWEFFYICLNGRDLMRLWRTLVLRVGPVITLGETSKALRQAAAACDAVLHKQVTSQFIASGLVYATVMALMEECLPEARPDQVPAFIEPVVRFCRDHLAEPIGVEDLARAAGLSRYHFTRRFQSTRGISPGRFLCELRLQESVRLIQTGQFSVKEIASRCGFSDANYFCKVFRKSFGVSPGAFKSSGMY